jgi:hypothetical protein
VDTVRSGGGWNFRKRYSPSGWLCVAQPQAWGLWSGHTEVSPWWAHGGDAGMKNAKTVATKVAANVGKAKAAEAENVPPRRRSWPRQR